MRKLTGIVAALLLVTSWAVFAAPAGAAVLHASDLAADCNDDGLVNITADTRYVGGSADIVGGVFGSVHMCLVDFRSPGLTLTIQNVDLRGSGDASFNIGQRSAFADTHLIVKNSTIDMHAPDATGGFVSVKSGCCAGEPFEARADVEIQGTMIRGTSVELGASLAAPDGTLSVTNSDVTATGDTLVSAPDIEIRVGVGTNGTNGALTVRNTTFQAADGFRARTGATGTTTLIADDLTGVGGSIVVTTGAGGTCSTSRMTPAVSCT